MLTSGRKMSSARRERPMAKPIATPTTAASAKPAKRRMSVSSTWCGRIPAAVRRTNAAAISSSGGNSRFGKTPRCAVSSHNSATTRNGKAVRAITRHRLSRCAADVPARTWADTAGASSDMRSRYAGASAWTSMGCFENDAFRREMLPRASWWRRRAPSRKLRAAVISLPKCDRADGPPSRPSRLARGLPTARTTAPQTRREKMHGVYSQQQQLQGWGLSRQDAYSVGRLRVRLRGQQPISASCLVGGARRHEELCRHLFRSGCTHGQRVLALAGGEYPAERDRAASRCRQPEESEAAGGSAADPDRLRCAGLWRSVPAAGRSPAPLSVHGVRGRHRQAAGDRGHLGGRHRLSAPFQYPGQGGDHGALQTLTTPYETLPRRLLTIARPTCSAISATLHASSKAAIGRV